MIDEIDNQKDIIKVQATILLKKSQKQIVIGASGGVQKHWNVG